MRTWSLNAPRKSSFNFTPESALRFIDGGYAASFFLISVKNSLSFAGVRLGINTQKIPSEFYASLVPRADAQDDLILPPFPFLPLNLLTEYW